MTSRLLTERDGVKDCAVIFAAGDEVVSGIRDFATYEGKPALHAHAVLGLHDGTTRGGHLIEAVTYPTVELFVTAVGPRARTTSSPREPRRARRRSRGVNNVQDAPPGGPYAARVGAAAPSSGRRARPDVNAHPRNGDAPLMTATTTAPTTAPTTDRKLDRPPSTRTHFDPEQFLVVPPRTFEQLNLGDVFRAPSRTLTDAHTLAFQAISMDNHPRHFNQEYAQGHKLQAMLVHPLQVLAFTALGATLLTHYIGEVLIAFTDVAAKFERDSFVGDTLYSALEITELATADGQGHVTCAMTIYNQRGELVLTGEQHLVLKLTPGSASNGASDGKKSDGKKSDGKK